jgi:hypothetical protein
MALPAVVATADQRKSYRVIEGNRRILALRALETCGVRKFDRAASHSVSRPTEFAHPARGLAGAPLS